uniref:THO complex subunit 3 n=1 Tax=Ditylenchus dipsaci TaxID=166011 RepID=A0A915CWJ5_9BILA
MVKDQEPKEPQKEIKDSLGFDDSFRNPSVSSEFFKRKDRSRPYESQEAVGVRCLSWNKNGSYLACGADNRVISVGVVDPRSTRLKQTLVISDHDDGVEAVEFSKHDENVLASCSSDKTVRIFDVRAPKSGTKIPTKESNLFLSWSNCGNFITYGDKGDTVSILEIRTNKVLESATFKEEINEFIVHPNGEFLFLTTDHGKLEIISLPKLKRIRTIQGSPSTTILLFEHCNVPNECFLTIGGSDACSSIWDLRDMICINTITRLDYPVRTVSYSHCGNLIASGSEDRVIDIAWATTGEKVAEVAIQSECFDVAWNPHLYLLAYATGASAEGLRERDRADSSTVKIFGYSS